MVPCIAALADYSQHLSCGARAPPKNLSRASGMLFYKRGCQHAVWDVERCGASLPTSAALSCVRTVSASAKDCARNVHPHESERFHSVTGTPEENHGHRKRRLETTTICVLLPVRRKSFLHPSQLRKRIGASGVFCLVALDSLLKKCLGGLDIIIQKILNQRGENFFLVIADMDISLRPQIGNIQNHPIRTSLCHHMI